MKGAEPGGGVDGERGDLLGRLGRHLLDVDAAFGRGDEGDAAGAAIDQQRKVKLTRNRGVLHHIDAAHDAPLRPRLRRDQGLAEHAVGLGVQLFEGLDQLDAAAFAAAAGMTLRLHHQGTAAERLGVRSRLVRGCGDAAFGDRRAVLLQEILGLIFVDIHVKTFVCLQAVIAGSDPAIEGPCARRWPPRRPAQFRA